MSNPFDIKHLDQRYLDILAAAREHFGTETARRGEFRHWFEETYGKRTGAKHAYVPAEIIKNGYLQAGRGRYWLDPNLMNDVPMNDQEQPTAAEEIEGGATVEEEADAAFDTAFSLERDLERSLLSNLEQLASGLKLYTRDGRKGQQFWTDVGIIDILAVDPQNELIVIELKAGRADEKAIGQILRYIGWVQTKLSEPDQAVKGIIIANDFSDALKYAAAAVHFIQLKQYQLNFKFTNV